MSEEIEELGRRVSAARAEAEERGETFYPGPSRVHLASFPPKERWDDWVELDSTAWPDRVEKRYALVPTTCFNCESACGLLAYVDRDTLQVRKFEGNPEHPGSRGRNCAKGPATINQVTDPDRILYPLKRAGARGEGKWVQVDWDEALDDIAGRIRTAIQEDRANEVMYHVGRPGEDGFTERVMASWGVDGHNSHTNVCSSGARVGFQLWMGIDRPSPDHANADVIYLISSHLETGHYFNPHAQRITEARRAGAKLIVLDTRLSNTATHADHWLSPYPGSEAAINLAIANHIIRTRRYDREFVRRWWNWDRYLAAVHPDRPRTFEAFEEVLAGLYADFTFEFAADESGIPADTLAEVAEIVAGAGSRFDPQLALRRRRQPRRMAGLAHPLPPQRPARRRRHPRRHPSQRLEQVRPQADPLPAAPTGVERADLAARVPAGDARAVLPAPPFRPGGAGEHRRVLHPRLQPGVDQPRRVLVDRDADRRVEDRAACRPHPHVERDGLFRRLHPPDGAGVGTSRRPLLRAVRRAVGGVPPAGAAGGEDPGRRGGHRHPPGEPRRGVGGERVLDRPELADRPRRVDGHPPVPRVPRPSGRAARRRRVLRLDVRELGSRAPRGSRRGGAHPPRVHAALRRLRGPARGGCAPRAAGRRRRARRCGRGRVRSGLHEGPQAARPQRGPAVQPRPGRGGPASRRGAYRRRGASGVPHAVGEARVLLHHHGRLGVGEHALPGYIRSHIHPHQLDDGQMPLISTFRLPVQIHTRSANSKWLDEIAHTNPVWVHPSDARRLGVSTGDLVRVETEIGYFVVKAWVTEGIRPGVVACSHHMGRWKIADEGQRQAMATVALDHDDSRWGLRRRRGGGPYQSSDPDTTRIWWTDVGVHQNLTFPVQPDPISGQHCWHQAVRVVAAQPGDAYGDISVDTDAARAAYRRWLELTRGADDVSPDATRRPYWFLRPLKPSCDVYALPGR